MKLMEINESVLNDYIEELVDERMKKIKKERTVYFLNTKQLEEYLGMSWPTITKVFLDDPAFPVLRKGKHYIFNKKELDEYLDEDCEEVKNSTGDILKYRRKGWTDWIEKKKGSLNAATSSDLCLCPLRKEFKKWTKKL